MKTQAAPRLVRLGLARKLTRALTEGDYAELNPVKRYIVPPSE